MSGKEDSPPAYQAQQTGQPLVTGVFDQGARFDPNKPATIPPPPPGVAPTPAQQAAAQGQSVFMAQQKRDIWGGGSDGGSTFLPQPVPQPAQSETKPTSAQATGQPMMTGVYDQGARIDPNKPATIPPPPPGVAPTAAQQAAAQGQTVEMTQQKRDNWGVGSDGGSTMF